MTNVIKLKVPNKNIGRITGNNQENRQVLKLFSDKEGLFDITNPDMEKNVGRLVLAKSYKKQGNGNLSFIKKIIGIQNTYKPGKVVYRVESIAKPNCFGSPMAEEDLFFLDELDPIEVKKMIRADKRKYKRMLDEYANMTFSDYQYE